MMPLPNITALSDRGLLALYGRAATNVMLTRLFNQPGPSEEILDAVRELSREISDRGLDQGPAHAN